MVNTTLQKLTCGLAFATAIVSAPAQNLISNGNFESGTSGFVSDYSYTDQPVCDAAMYSVVNYAQQVHPAWTTAPDHTFGNYSGKYFVGNGSDDTTKTVWMTDAPVHITLAGVAYRFEAYVSTLYTVSGGNGPELTFQVGNGGQWTNLGSTYSFPDGAAVGAWNLSYADGVFNAPGDYYIRLLNAQPALGGNDFGLDDLFFGFTTSSPSYSDGIGTHITPVSIAEAAPEPSTLVPAFLGGLGMLWWLRRRK